MKRNTKLRLLGCTLIVAMFLSLLPGCGGGAYSQEIEKPPASLMDPAAWEIGPIMWGDNASKGVPLHPSAHQEGWFIDVPYPTREQGHVHYVTVPTGPLTPDQTITLRLRIEADPATKLVPVKFPDAKGLITLYFQQGGDMWTGEGQYRWYRWYAKFGTVTDPRSGELVMTARLDDPRWGAVMGGTAATNPAEFAAALDGASRIGFVLGGGDGLGHGVYATGSLRLVVTGFVTSVTPAEEPEGAPTVSTRPGQVAVVEAMAAQAGFDLPPGTIGALFEAIDVTDVYEVGPHERLAQLGLAIITEEAA